MLFQPSNYRGFNCYSYAVNVRDEWLNMSRRDLVHDLFDASNKKERERVSKLMAESIIDKFPKLKIITKNEIKKNTRLIAFRCAKHDYHFMKRFTNNHWFHKMGDEPIEAIKTEKVFSNKWYGSSHSYDTEIIFFGYREDYQ